MMLLSMLMSCDICSGKSNRPFQQEQMCHIKSKLQKALEAQKLLWNMFNATLWFVAFVEGGFVLQFALSVKRLLAIVMEKYISA